MGAVSQRAGVLLGTFFGVGYFPLFPGTLASAIVVGLFLLLWPAADSPLWLLAIAVVGLPFAVAAAGVCVQRFGAADPRQVVVDEVLGQMIALAALPRGLPAPSGWKYGLLGLILFRVFDIVKPFPVGSMERLPRGWGVVSDDYAAGLYAFAMIRVVVWWAR